MTCQKMCKRGGPQVANAIYESKRQLEMFSFLICAKMCRLQDLLSEQLNAAIAISLVKLLLTNRVSQFDF